MWSRVDTPAPTLRGPAARPRLSRAEPGRLASELVAVDDPVREPVLHRLLGGEESVTVHVAVHLVLAALGVVGVDRVHPASLLEDLAGVDVDVGGRALEAGGRLMDEDLRVR